MFPHVSRAPDKAKMENPPPFLKWNSVLPFPSLPPHWLRVPWDTVPCPILMVGKHILIDALTCLYEWMCVCECVYVRACVQSLNEDACRNDAAEQRRLVVLCFLRLAWWVIYPLRWTDGLGSWNSSWEPGKDTNGRWLIDRGGKRMGWYWYHHWCNMIEVPAESGAFFLCHLHQEIGKKRPKQKEWFICGILIEW